MDFGDIFTQTVKITEDAVCSRTILQTARESSSLGQIVDMVWALPKPRPGQGEKITYGKILPWRAVRTENRPSDKELALC